MSNVSGDCNGIKITTKIIDISLNPVFFILSCDQSFDMFPRHNEYARISESFALNLIISVPLTNE